MSDKILPDVIYITDVGATGGTFQLYHSGRNETAYTRTPAEPIAVDAREEENHYANMVLVIDNKLGRSWTAQLAEALGWNPAALKPSALLDPDMPADEMRLHMGEMSAQELRTARAAIRWANTRQPSGREEGEELDRQWIERVSKLQLVEKTSIPTPDISQRKIKINTFGTVKEYTPDEAYELLNSDKWALVALDEQPDISQAVKALEGLKKPEPKWTEDVFKQFETKGYNAAVQACIEALTGKRT